MKKLLFSILAILILFVSGYFWWNTSVKPLNKSEGEVNFLILKGASATQIANKLQNEDIIRSSLAFKFYVQLTGRAKKIKSGEYQISPAMSMFEIVSDLLKGPKALWVTIPEGLRREEIAEKFIQGLSKSESDGNIFRDEFLQLSNGEEGYLFPDTYLLPKTITASKVFNLMKSTFNGKTADISFSKHSLNEVVIVASLLERETITDAEKPIVAGIIYKRLENDWPLQIDATIQYALASKNCGSSSVNCDWWKKSLTRDDIAINSSYNTYKLQGLPPAPISNPGLSSLEAAASPEGSLFWFYIHDSKGTIHYGKTIEEHNKNISKYLGK